MNSTVYSFIIPAFNDAPGLARHLDYFGSIRRDIEIIVVDDCSTDETPSVIRAADMPENIKIIYHRLPENAGAGAARNAGLELVSGDIVMFLDADDQLADCFFDYMDLSPIRNGADFVMFRYHLCATPSERYTYNMHTGDNQFFSSMPMSSFPAQLFTLGNIPAAARTIAFPWNKVYRRDFLDSIRLRFPEQRMHEDIAPHWQSFLRARRFGVLNWAPPLIHHYEHQFGCRATNYVGPERLAVFATLAELANEVRIHEDSNCLMAELGRFCEDIFHWMQHMPGIEASADSRHWKQQYMTHAAQFRATFGLNDPLDAATLAVVLN